MFRLGIVASERPSKPVDALGEGGVGHFRVPPNRRHDSVLADGGAARDGENLQQIKLFTAQHDVRALMLQRACGKVEHEVTKCKLAHAQAKRNAWRAGDETGNRTQILS